VNVTGLSSLLISMVVDPQTVYEFVSIAEPAVGEILRNPTFMLIKRFAAAVQTSNARNFNSFICLVYV